MLPEGGPMTNADRAHVLPSKPPSAVVVAPTEPNGSSAEGGPEEKPIILVRNLAMTVLACLAVVVLLQFAQSVLVPIVIGILISYGLAPFVGGLQRLRVPRALGAAVAGILVRHCPGLGHHTLTQ